MVAEQRIGNEVGVERGLELVDEVAGGHAPEQFSGFGGQSRVTGSASLPAGLEQLFSSTHRFHDAYPRSTVTLMILPSVGTRCDIPEHRSRPSTPVS